MTKRKQKPKPKPRTWKRLAVIFDAPIWKCPELFTCLGEAQNRSRRVIGSRIARVTITEERP